LHAPPDLHARLADAERKHVEDEQIARTQGSYIEGLLLRKEAAEGRAEEADTKYHRCVASLVAEQDLHAVTSRRLAQIEKAAEAVLHYCGRDGIAPDRPHRPNCQFWFDPPHCNCGWNGAWDALSAALETK